MEYQLLKVFVDDIMVRLRMHVALANAHHEPYTDAQANALIATHAAVASVHHTNHQVASAEDADFKSVNIASGEAYKQNGIDLFKAQSTYCIFIGEEAGIHTTGDYNTFIGRRAGYANSSGKTNTFIAQGAGYHNTSGKQNTFIGPSAGYNNTTGRYNTFIGPSAGRENTTGERNAYIGSGAGYNGNGSYNVSIGFMAGYHETGSYKLFIDSISRASEADGRIKALIYGIFAASPANQLIRLNAILEITAIKLGATQADAGAGANEVWKTNGHATLPDNVLMIGV